MDTSRFYCASASLHLGMLLKPARKVLWSATILAVASHILLTQIGSRQAAQEAAKPLTTQFVKRQPRLTKPLELKKRPRPRQRRIQRTMVSVKARVDHGKWAMRLRPASMVAQLARPDPKVVRVAAFQSAVLEPETVAQTIEGTRQAENVVDMSLEMVDIEALDTGQYHAMVIQDPNDKRNIQGFFHLALTYSMSLIGGKEIRYINWDPRYTRHLTNLCDAMNRYTQIKTDFQGIYTYDSGEILKVPWIYASAFTSFAVTLSEAKNLGTYLLNGGFFFADVIPCGVQNDPRNAIPMDQSLRGLYKQSLATQGWAYPRDWDFERLPNSHSIYHCFFDFDAGPPMAGDVWYGVNGLAPSPFDYLEGITIEGRLVGILSNKFYQDAWGHQFLWKDKDPTRPLQFGVNLIVFALTQEGSITNRIMDSVK